MNKIICDICKREITPADIHISFNIDVENKSERLDFHSICFAYFKDNLKVLIETLEEEK